MIYIKITLLLTVLICASSHLFSLINVEDNPSIEQATRKRAHEYKKYLEQEKRGELCKADVL